MVIAAVRTARVEVITENTGYSYVFAGRSNIIIIIYYSMYSHLIIDSYLCLMLLMLSDVFAMCGVLN